MLCDLCRASDVCSDEQAQKNVVYMGGAGMDDLNGHGFIKMGWASGPIQGALK